MATTSWCRAHPRHCADHNPNTGCPVKDFTHVAYFGGPPMCSLCPPGLGEILAGSRQLREDAQRDVDVASPDRYQRAPRCGILRPEGRNQDRAHPTVAAPGVLTWLTSSLRLDDPDDGRRSDRAGTVVPLAVSARRGSPTSLLFRPSEAGYPDLVSTTCCIVDPPGFQDIVGKTRGDQSAGETRGHGPAESRADIDRTDDPGGIHAYP